MAGVNLAGGQVTWIWNADTGAFTRAVVQTEQQARKSTENIEKDGKKVGKSFADSAKDVIALGASFGALRSLASFIKGSIQIANEYESSMIGLATVSQRFGYDAMNALESARSLASDGLIPVSTAASGLQKLLTAGVGLDTATQLMEGYKDQAAFGRASTISFRDAVNNLAESFYTENSMIGNLSGQTENWNLILERGARALGKNVSELNDQERIQAKVIGQTQLNTLVTGDAARMSDIAAGASAKLATQYTDMRIKIGQVANAFSKGLILRLGEFIQANQDTIINIVAMGGAFLAGAAAVVAMTKVVAISRVVINALKGPVGWLTLALGAIAGVTAGIATEHMLKQIGDIGALIPDVETGTGNVGSNLEDAAKKAEDLRKELARIDKDIAEANQNYREQLAELVANKEQSIRELREQLKEEADEYNQSYRERLIDYQKSEAEELASHEDKVLKLQGQIDFLRKYNNAANRKKLSELQFALAKENSQYAAQTRLRQEEYGLEEQAAIESYEKRRTELEIRLNEEQGLLDKHADEVAAIRDVILLDEIEKLKQSRDKQLESLEEQKQNAIGKNAEAGSAAGWAFDTNFQKFLNDIVNNSGIAGANAGNSFWDTFKQFGANIAQGWENIKKYGPFALFGGGSLWTWDSIERRFQGTVSSGGFSGRASGGSVSANMPYFVGENPDGSLNKTSELFIPKTSGYIMNSQDLQSALSNSTPQVVYNISVNAGVLTTKTQQRELAGLVVTNIQQMNRAKGII